jgi:RNA polymerase sigma factor FliA
MQATVQPSEIEQLWVQLGRDRDPALRERLIVQYAPLVKYVVGRMAVSMPGLLSNEDIVGYGTVGLIQAVDRYDPSVGVKFETYAIRRIKGAIIDAIRSLQALSRDASRRARDLDHAYDELIQRLGRLPTNREVADHLEMTAEEFSHALADASMSIVSLNNATGPDAGDGGERPSLIDQIADEDAPGVADQVERRQLYQALVKALQQLGDRDRLVINLYYYEDLTLKEISDVLGVSTSRVSQLHAAAVFKLRAALRIAAPRAAGEGAAPRGRRPRGRVAATA